jgi:Lar family restriction alleviation protein
MTQLKPCPFCGNVARARQQTSDERSGYQTTVTIYCIDCGAKVSAADKLSPQGWSIAKEGETLAAAAEKWNRRA